MQNKTITVLVSLTLFFKTVPVLANSLLPFAPINFITLISIIYLIINKQRLLRTIQNKSILIPFSFFLFYYTLLYVFGILQMGMKPNLIVFLQNFVFFILVSFLDWPSVRNLFKLYVTLLFFELAFSLLIYFIGEPL